MLNSSRLQNQYLLKELRLNDNKIFKLPPSLAINVRLEVLDLGSNRLSKLEYADRFARLYLCAPRDIEPLRELKALKDLVLLGNPICKIDSYRAKVL
jgi:Leucine-rich repeat (LRR) protein